MQPCGEPVEVKRVSERLLLTSTFGNVFVRKLTKDPQNELVVEVEAGDQFLS